ncbi:MAG: hypothetical protein KJO07_11070, partial [Deltaproteobacteria bacterium]|nr:hypothetical protein [Deltaproteobacteria bacterium]
RWPLVIALTAGLGCSSDEAPLADADAGVDGGDVCTPFSTRTCDDNAVYWQDSCGARGELIEECIGGAQCSQAFGECCAPANTSGQMPAQPWPIRVNWTFAPGSELVATIEVHDDPGETFEMTFDVDFTIDGSLYFFSLENHHPVSGNPGSKKGIRLYNVRSGDVAAIRTSSGAISGNSTETRVTLPYFWEAGHTYTFTMSRAESQAYQAGTADWFDLTVSEDGGTPVEVGGILIPRTTEATPLNIDGFGTQYKILNYDWVSPPAELNGELADYSALTMTFDSTINLQLDGAEPLSRIAVHGTDAGSQVWTNIDAGLDADGGLRMAFGSGVATCHDPGAL